jgi:hypothetical protein
MRGGSQTSDSVVPCEEVSVFGLEPYVFSDVLLKTKKRVNTYVLTERVVGHRTHPRLSRYLGPLESRQRYVRRGHLSYCTAATARRGCQLHLWFTVSPTSISCRYAGPATRGGGEMEVIPQ